MQINAKDKAPAQQVFDQFLREAGGNAVQAQKAYNLAFGDKNDPNKKYIELLLADKAKVIGGPLAGSELGLKQLANIDAEIARMSKASVSAKTATMADIEATAKAKGKTVQETLAAAKAQGFVVQ